VAATGYTNAVSMSHVFLTTNMAAVAGGLGAIFYTWVFEGKPSLSMLCNGILAGLVGITAGCDCVDIWASIVIGFVTSIIMCFSVGFIDKKLHIDDPVGAVSVHGVGGFVGTLLTGVFANPSINGVSCSLGIQVLGAVVVCAFSFICGMIIFFTIKHTHGLRCDKRIEEEGLDIYEHGEACYN
jgi:ammonium transporter, Amt family